MTTAQHKGGKVHKKKHARKHTHGFKLWSLIDADTLKKLQQLKGE